MCHIPLRWTQTLAYSDNKPHTCEVSSPVTHTHIFFSEQITGGSGFFQVNRTCSLSSSTSQWSAHVFDEELRKVFVVFKTFLQLSHEESDGASREVSLVSIFKQHKLHPTPPPTHTAARLTLCASRRSGGCSQRRFCLFLSCRRGRPFPRSSSWSPAETHEVSWLLCSLLLS